MERYADPQEALAGQKDLVRKRELWVREEQILSGRERDLANAHRTPDSRVGAPSPQQQAHDDDEYDIALAQRAMASEPDSNASPLATASCTRSALTAASASPDVSRTTPGCFPSVTQRVKSSCSTRLRAARSGTAPSCASRAVNRTSKTSRRGSNATRCTFR